jgi:hypothetical protein
MTKRMLIVSVLIICILVVFKFCGNKPEVEKVPEQKPEPLGISRNSGTFNESFSKLLQSYFSLKDCIYKC